MQCRSIRIERPVYIFHIDIYAYVKLHEKPGEIYQKPVHGYIEPTQCKYAIQKPT